MYFREGNFKSSAIFCMLLVALFTCSTVFATVGPIADHTLITEPDDGTAFIVDKINGAKETIAVTIYQFDNSTPLYDALLAAAERGVKVNLTYNYYSFGNNYGQPPSVKQESINTFMQSLTKQSANFQTHQASDIYLVTHQKGMVIDNKEAFICSFNFISSYFGGTRDFAIYTTVPAEVNEMAAVAAADFTDNCKEQIPPGTIYPDSQLTVKSLLWSDSTQGNSRAKETALIQSAKHSIYMYQELVEDSGMIEVICNALKANPKLDVRIIAPQLNNSSGVDGNLAGLQKIKAAGGQYIEIPESATNKLYVHAKMILVDYRPKISYPTEAAYVGSVNFSYASLNENRESGIIFYEKPLLASLHATFLSDWNNGGGNLPPASQAK